MKKTRGRRAAWTVGGMGREEREPSRQWRDSVLVRDMALGCEEKNRNAGTERPE
jgi:hypothetical protein